MKRVGEYNNLVKDIKSIKIQGAENVAKAGIKAYMLMPYDRSAKEILNIRATEPLLQNAIALIKKSKNKNKTAEEFIKELKTSHQIISETGSRLIKNNMKIYSHCHSSTVIDILIHAKKEGKTFTVYTTEVEPLLQGRMTANDLAKHNIKIVIAPDLAAETLISDADIVLFGADAFSQSGLANKIGTTLICRLARHYNIPRFACGVSLKYTKKIKIEKRAGREVWKDNKKNIEVIYPAFDKTKYNLITGIISEFGILKPKHFVKKAKLKLKRLG